MRLHLRQIVTWTLYQKREYLTDRSDVIFEVPKSSKIQIFRGSARTPLGELTQRPPSWWRRNSLPHPLKPHFRPWSFDQASLLWVSGFNPLQRWLLLTANMITILLIHNNAYSYLLVLYLNPKTLTVSQLVTPSKDP